MIRMKKMNRMKRLTVSVIAALALASAMASVAGANPGDSADLRVSVAADKTSYKVGDTVTYTVTIANYGEAAADQVTFTDLLPAGLQLVSANLTQSPDASTDASFTSSSVPTGPLALDPLVQAIDPSGDAYNAARISNGAQLDLGYSVGTSGGETLVTGQLGWLGSSTYWSADNSTETITIVAQATANGSLTNVASVDSTSNPDPYEMNNFAATAVTVG
jgi:uncharacterized repeat protein (TIGR01451 family)